MREIMISIKPEWVSKILNGEKTIDIRKTMPKCKLPCKVYIYCTKGTHKKDVCAYNCKTNTKGYSHCQVGNGKVVAEFTLNKIGDILYLPLDEQYYVSNQQLKQMGMEWFYGDLHDYGNGKDLKCWHIDNLKVYDKPKELNEFYNCKLEMMKRPPQSWMYVKKKENSYESKNN